MEVDIRSEAEINELAETVQGYACDKWALEHFPSLEPGGVDEVGDTQDPAFYTEYNKYMQLEPSEVELAESYRQQGVDLGHQFDWISEEFAKRAVYDPAPYSAVLSGLNSVLAKLDLEMMPDTPFDDVQAMVDEEISVDASAYPVPADWHGDFIDSLKNDVLRYVPHHRPCHYVLVFQLIAAIRSQMNLHETYRSRLYDIAACTRNKYRGEIYDDPGAGFIIATKVVGTALAIAGTIAALPTGGSGLVLSALGSGLSMVTTTVGIKDDFTKAQDAGEEAAAAAPTGEITGSTAVDIADSMMEAIHQLDEDIRAEESRLGEEITAAAGSLSDVVAAADQTTGLTADWAPWMVRAKRTYLADHHPDANSEMNNDNSDHLA